MKKCTKFVFINRNNISEKYIIYLSKIKPENEKTYVKPMKSWIQMMLIKNV